MHRIFQHIFLRIFYNSWPAFNSSVREGYSVLLPLPGELPVFLKFAFDWLKVQKKDNLVEILVIPNKLTKGFYETFKEIYSDNRHLHLRLVPLTFLYNLAIYIALYLKDVHKTHPFQIIRAINNVSTNYALLNDADLFVIDRNFMEKQYKICLEKDLFCLGVSKTWDNWFEENNIRHIVATWQLMFNVSWIRCFRPFQIFPQEAKIEEKTHNFDTSFLIQHLTNPEKITKSDCDTNFVHFEYVICTFDKFRASKIPFKDSYFRILFIRVLINAYDCIYSDRYVPDMQELIRGTKDSNAKVTYLDENISTNYLKFRNKMQRIIDSGILSDDKIKKIQNDLNLFDKSIK